MLGASAGLTLLFDARPDLDFALLDYNVTTTENSNKGPQLTLFPHPRMSHAPRC